MRKFCWAALLLLVLSVTLAAAENRAKYVFLFVGDGMGENIRKYYQHEFPDSALEKFPVTVRSGTDNVFGKTTDSAASGTAIACGIKTYNGAIGVSKDRQPVTSLAKILRDNGFSIAVITSVGINDATPSAHYANRFNRKDTAGTMSDLYASDFNFFAGGFLLKNNDYSNSQYRRLLEQVKYTLCQNFNFNEKTPRNRVLFLGSMEPDWPEAPQKRHLLSEVTGFAIQSLQDNPKGFFMLIEGGAIDHRAHNNDLGGTMREMREFDLAVKTALEFQKKHPQDTLIVITSDHDTGGMNIHEYKNSSLWNKQIDRAINADKKLKKEFKKLSDEDVIKYLVQYFGMGELSADELKAMQDVIKIQRNPELAAKQKEFRSMYGSYNPIVVQMMRLRDARCGVSWQSFSHTNRKVLTNAMGAGEEHVKAVKENSDIPHAISKAVFGKDVMNDAAQTLPHLQSGNMEEYFKFITLNSTQAVFRYGQKNAAELEFIFQGPKKDVKLQRSDRAGRIVFDQLETNSEYSLQVKRNGKVIAKSQIKTLPAAAGKLIARIGVIADSHVSLDPDARYGRMHSQSVSALENAVKLLTQRKVDFIALPGDITDASRQPELKAIAKIISQNSAMKFYAVPGNHDRLTDKNFSQKWLNTFGPPARLEKHGKLQILLLDTGNGYLADKEANIKAVEALDPALPVVVISHYQLVGDGYLKDKDRAIHDSEKAAGLLKKLAAMQGVIIVGHKNIATSAKLGNLLQVNMPQLTQFPAGVIYAELFTDGIRLEFVTAHNEFFDEYGRIRGNIMGQKQRFRDRHSLTVWNNFYKLDLKAAGN